MWFTDQGEVYLLVAGIVFYSAMCGGHFFAAGQHIFCLLLGGLLFGLSLRTVYYVTGGAVAPSSIWFRRFLSYRSDTMYQPDI